jgi:phage replication-related protein YjqB (UPF0714/DUF867 family)
VRLTGDRNQCQGCKEYFNSTFAFDKHRVGDHGVDRRCLTPDEMRAKGMDVSASGYWVSALNTQAFPADLAAMGYTEAGLETDNPYNPK